MMDEQMKKDLTRIMDRHMGDLFRDLRARGYDVVGMAGGVVFSGDDDPESDCFTFYRIVEGIKRGDGKPFDVDAFVGDVAGAMVKPPHDWR